METYLKAKLAQLEKDLEDHRQINMISRGAIDTPSVSSGKLILKEARDREGKRDLVRDRAMVLLSLKADLCAIEIAIASDLDQRPL